MTDLMPPTTLEQIIRRLEFIHRALRAADDCGCDPRLVEAVAGCLRELHAIAAQSVDEARLRLVDPPRVLH